MRGFLQVALSAALATSLIGCGADNIETQDVSGVASTENPVEVVAVENENPYKEMGETDYAVQSDDAGFNDEESDEINYKKVIDSEKGMAALNAGKDAVIAGVGAIDKQQVALIGSALASGASQVVKSYTQKNSDKADISNSSGDYGADWKTLNTTGVRVIDGDTVEVLVANSQSERIRLLGIDAPESDQEYGTESTDALKACIGDKPVSIVYKKEDHYGRILGVVMAGNTDCNLVQAQTGAAWHYKQYKKDQLPGTADTYSKAESDAKSASKGLWANSNPQAPWEYRRAK